ncbi:DegV family protein [Alkalicoccus chagannorensis]|uniref:DegV family protein n=1 Tax=Alkalicoccus chagannorensis TaxID=427072 RepID=UPI00047CBD01|nr:DegV family protein [Alkalicoccus chagannorensis]
MSGQVQIVTDSTLDLDEELISRYGIHVVPLSVTVDGVSYKDGVDVSRKEYLTMLTSAEELPKSSQPSPGDFQEVYDNLYHQGHSSIVSIHMSSGMSGTYTSAEQAAALTEAEVSVIDSAYISTALGFQVLEAAVMAADGRSPDEIIDRLERVRSSTSLYIMVDTLEYLLKGGRIGRGRALVGSLLKIKPIASLEDGVYTPVTKARTHAQVLKQLQQLFEKDTNGKTVKGAGIAHAGALELSGKLKEKLAPASGAEISIIDTTPIISTHTGPGAVALMFYTEPDEEA